MSPKTLSFATALSFAFLAPSLTRADDPPMPTPTPAPTEKPADKPAEKPTEKPAEKPTDKPPETTSERGFIGFTPAPAAALSPKQKEHWHVTATTGVVAVRVFKGSPADLAGFHNGDVILKYAGKDVPATKDLDVKDPAKVQAWTIAFGALSGTVKDGSVVEIVVEREGKPVTLKATAIGMDAMLKIAKAAGEDEDGEEDEGDEGDEGGEKGEKGEKPANAPEKPAPEKPVAPK